MPSVRRQLSFPLEPFDCFPAASSGWIHVDCPSTSMAGWLVRAVNMENVSAHVDGMILHLPAGPRFRLEKEIKNVITAIAKTCHYWLGHTSVAQHRAIADLFKVMEPESPLIHAPFSARNTRTAAFETLRDTIAGKIHSQTGLEATAREYHGWLGVSCLNVRAAIWMMRVMVASNVLCRREGNFIYVPVNPSTDRKGDRITALFGPCTSRGACSENDLTIHTTRTFGPLRRFANALALASDHISISEHVEKSLELD
jgi:sirohydrochlorin cobaltochelatase